jgi:rhodanese-related sulfurtransferase
MLGFTNVSVLDGGIEGWKKAGYEVVDNGAQ